MHPDKIKDRRATDAFHVLEQAKKSLLDSDKRKVYQRVMREAQERVEYERKKINQKRKIQGLPLLPDETLEIQVKQMAKQLFEEIEERKLHYHKLELANKKRYIYIYIYIDKEKIKRHLM